MDRCTVRLIGSAVVYLGVDSLTDKTLKMNVSENYQKTKKKNTRVPLCKH